MFVSAVKSGIFVWCCLDIGSLLESATSGHLRYCIFGTFMLASCFLLCLLTCLPEEIYTVILYLNDAAA